MLTAAGNINQPYTALELTTFRTLASESNETCRRAASRSVLSLAARSSAACMLNERTPRFGLAPLLRSFAPHGSTRGRSSLPAVGRANPAATASTTRAQYPACHPADHGHDGDGARRLKIGRAPARPSQVVPEAGGPL